MFSEIFAKAYYASASPDKTINGFKCTGIHPLNRTVFYKTFGVGYNPEIELVSLEKSEIGNICESEPNNEVEKGENLGKEPLPNASSDIQEIISIDCVPDKFECKEIIIIGENIDEAQIIEAQGSQKITSLSDEECCISQVLNSQSIAESVETILRKLTLFP